MEITGFTRMIWKTPEYKEKWVPRLYRIERMYSTAEYEMVKRGYRKACTTHIDTNNLDKVITKLNNDKLIFTPITRSGYYEGFAHRHKPIKDGDPSYWFGCITKTVEDGLEFKKSESSNDKTISGKYLGYPDCCIEYFNEVFCGQKNYDYIWEMVDHKDKTEVTVRGHKECNQMLRYFNATRLTSHLPCSITCDKTKKIGQKWLKVMKSIDKSATEYLIELLSSPMTWNSYHGIVEVDTPYFIGVSHTYPFMDKPRIIHWDGEL